MRKKNCSSILLILLFILPAFLAYGQPQDGHTSLSAGIASPTAASLGRYGDIPVSEFTGTPQITVPLFELQGRSLTLPIELSYHSSGVRVEEIAGWAGLGWSLGAGGVITRTVRGLPDDTFRGYLGRGGDSAAVNLPNTLSRTYLEKVHQFQLDGEPDRYFFNVAGRAGEIFLARDETATPYKYKAHTMPQQDIRIEMQKDPDTSELLAWILTTEDGTQYTFEQREETSQSIGGGGRSYTSSWYLTRVESATGNDVINLTYQEEGSVSFNQRREVEFTPLPGRSSSCLPPPDYTSDFRSSTSTVYLRQIETARHRAIFHLASRNDRGSRRLASIEIDHKSGATGWTPLRRYELVHGYFNSGESELHQRLRLDRVRQFDAASGELPFWSFAYDNSYALPSIYSFAQGYWGYYNGKNENTGLAPEITYNGSTYGSNDREPSEAHTLAGMLTEITYPTGGTMSFTWEGHRYGSSNTVGGGVRIKRIKQS